MNGTPLRSAAPAPAPEPRSPAVIPAADRSRDELTPDRPTRSAIFDALSRFRGLLLVVVLPTALTALYFFGFASKQYVSEAHFIVKTASQAAGNGGPGFGQMFGLPGVMNPSHTDAYSVGDYLSSHDAVAALEEKIGLTERFQRPEVDWVSRLRTPQPPSETLLKYYRSKVRVAHSPETGITTLTVRAFRPEDAHLIAETLLQFGEARVNVLSDRAVANTLEASERHLAEAEAEVAQAQRDVTLHRDTRRDLDPQRSATVQIELLGQMQGELAQANADLSSLGASVDAESPQYVAQKQRVEALQAQVSAQQARLAGSQRAMASGLGAYEDLQLRREFAAKRYEAAAAALESARQQAAKQQLYVVRVVEPNRPEKSTFPKPWLMVLSVLVGSALVYGVGWLIIAGVKEHAA